MNGKSIPKAGFESLLCETQEYLSRSRVNLLSYADKVILLKSLILALPTHLLVSCKVPKVVLDRMAKLMRSFL